MKPFTKTATALPLALILAAGMAAADDEDGRLVRGDGAAVDNRPVVRTTTLRAPDPDELEDHKPGGGGLWVNNGPDGGLAPLLGIETGPVILAEEDSVGRDRSGGGVFINNGPEADMVTLWEARE